MAEHRALVLVGGRWHQIGDTDTLKNAMAPAVYDPTGVGADMFDRSNHVGSVDVADITGLGTAATADIGSGPLDIAVGDHDHLGDYQAASADLDAISALTTPGLLHRTGDGTAEIVDVTSAGIDLIGATDVDAQKTLLGISAAASYEIGTTAGTIAEGNHNHDLVYEILASKNAANGYPGLGADGKVSSAQLPAITLNSTDVVADEAAQLALTVTEGHIAIRTDTSTTYVALNSTNASMSDWQELSFGAGVSSVNGQSGVVSLGKVDIGLGSVLNVAQLAIANDLSDLNDPSIARTNLGLGDSAIANVGTGSIDVAAGDHTHTGYQAEDTDLTAISNLSALDLGLLQRTATGTFSTVAIETIGVDFLAEATVEGQRIALGLGDAAVAAIGMAAGEVAAGDHTHTGYQTQSDDLDAIAAVTETGVYNRTGAGTVETVAVGVLGGLFLATDTSEAGRSLLSLGDSATKNTGDTASDVAAGNHIHDGVYSEVGHTHPYQPIDGDLTAIANLSTNGLVERVDNGLMTTAPLSAVSKTFLNKPTISDQRDALELGGSAILDIGTGAGTVAAGDHNHDLTYQATSEKGENGGYTPLNGFGKIPTIHLPAITANSTNVVASEVEQLALTVGEGDLAIRTDESKTYIALNATNASMSDWTEMLFPGGGVSSVNGNSGAVTITKADLGLTNVIDALQLDATLNLSDIPDAGTARTNLGLGAAAEFDVGMEAGKVAPGDHTHPDLGGTSAEMVGDDGEGGPDGVDGGFAGLVPAPALGDNVKFLRGDGSWAEVAVAMKVSKAKQYFLANF